MKKAVLAVLILVLGICTIACANNKDDNTSADAANGGSVGVASTDKGGDVQYREPDLSAYPDKLGDWSAEQLRDYFVDSGIFTDDLYILLQDHESSYPGVPINENTGCFNESGSIVCVIYTMMKDDSEGSVEEFLDYIREHHETPPYCGAMYVDHLADNVLFCYGWSQDQNFKDAMEAAYNRLITELGVTPDF